MNKGIEERQKFDESKLASLMELVIKINSRTTYCASAAIDSKAQAFKVIIYVNQEEKSKIAAYRNFISFKDLTEKYDNCIERLRYFYKDGLKSCEVETQ